MTTLLERMNALEPFPVGGILVNPSDLNALLRVCNAAVTFRRVYTTLQRARLDQEFWDAIEAITAEEAP